MILASLRDLILNPFKDTLPLANNGFIPWQQFYIELENVDEIKEWLHENLTKYSWLVKSVNHRNRFPYYQISFKHPEDAMAFKLRWL